MRTIPTSRVLLAFLLAPWIVPFVFLPYAWVTVPAAGPPMQRDLTPFPLTLGVLLMFGPASLMFAYCAELILGLPVWLILRRGHIASRTAFAAAGAGMGYVVHLVMTLWALERESITLTSIFDPSNPYLYISIAAGALSALLFHTILRFPRADTIPLMQRRSFVKTSGLGMTALSTQRILGANDRVNIALIGCGGRVARCMSEAPSGEQSRRLETPRKLVRPR